MHERFYYTYIVASRSLTLYIGMTGDLDKRIFEHKNKLHEESVGYEHEVIVLKTKKEEASELLPRVHLVISLLKRWLMGTHQGAVSHKHLVYYLDEFTFRFNRRKSMNRGKLFYRLIQQAVAIEPVTLDMILHPDNELARNLTHGKVPAKEQGITPIPSQTNIA